MEISTDYLLKRYFEFYIKNGYYPKFFNAYNLTELDDAYPSITTCCSSIVSVGGGRSFRS